MGILEKLFLILVGVMGKTLADKVLNKTKTIFYTVSTERIALSTDDPVFGNVKVEWHGHTVNNLYNTVIDIENTTSIDYENIKFKIWSNEDTLILNESTHIVDTTRIIEYSDEFKKTIDVPEGETPTDAQWQTFRHSRHYNIEVFNRGQKLRFTYLSTSLNKDKPSYIWVEMLHTGLNLKMKLASPQIHGVPVKEALLLGLLSLLLILPLSVIYINNIWAVAIICMVTAAVAQSIGAYIYKTMMFFRNLFIK